MKQDTTPFHSITAHVFIFKSSSSFFYYTISDYSANFLFGRDLVDEGCAYKSWNKQHGGYRHLPLSCDVL